ncbi:hypothetical protein, partial [Helicobacter heilmannii]|uniref:hypothetical protein n=1 Tax=Helicobacter heilmannii TaxID=35817 RepID=UPI001E50D280
KKKFFVPLDAFWRENCKAFERERGMIGCEFKENPNPYLIKNGAPKNGERNIIGWPGGVRKGV